MSEPVLCLVCLFLLGWVVALKSELARLKEDEPGVDPPPDTGVKAKRSAVKGSRSFKIE